MAQVITENIAGISELKADPMGTVALGGGNAIAILNRNTPAFYCVPPELYIEMVESIEDAHWNKIADTRANEPLISVELDDL